MGQNGSVNIGISHIEKTKGPACSALTGLVLGSLKVQKLKCKMQNCGGPAHRDGRGGKGRKRLPTPLILLAPIFGGILKF